jgi:putative salt-induced outer membrane protein
MVLAGGMLSLGAPCFAQPAPPEEPPPRLEATAQFSLLATAGNTQARSLGTGGEFIYRPKPWVFSGKAVYAESEAEDVLDARSFVGAFRATRELTERLSVYGQYGYLHDRFAGVEDRHTIDGGLLFALIARPPHSLDLNAGFGYERESRVEAEAEKLAIFSGGALYRWKFSETSAFVDDFRYVQALDNGGNWKLDQTAALTATLTSVFSLKLSSIVRYVHEPVPGFEPTDAITAVALVWSLKRPQP